MLLLLAALGAAVRLWWSASTIHDSGVRMVWAGLAAWCLLAVGLLCSAAGVRAALMGCVVAVMLGFAPWVGLGALAFTALVLPIAMGGGVLVLVRGAQGWAGKTFRLSVAATLVGLLCLGPAATCPDRLQLPAGDIDAQLEWLASSDQLDRRSACFVFNPTRDERRRALVKQRLGAAQQPLSPRAMKNAGLVLLHGSQAEELEVAYELLATARKRGVQDARPLENAAVDRLRLMQGLPQVHGTQWLHSP